MIKGSGFEAGSLRTRYLLTSGSGFGTLPVILYFNESIFVQCDFMDGRDAFLTMARDKHYEFSSLRRCKYSTLVMLYELHTQVREELHLLES